MVEDRRGSQRLAELAEALAHALDAEDYGSVGPRIAPDCVYETATAAIQGVEPIVASYAASAAWVRRTFEEVRYESRVEPIDDHAVAVEFTDYLMAAGHGWHRYRCRQEFTFGDDGRVIRIVHRELPGEREDLQAFLDRCGIQR